ncbi:hypothetical protein [Burkholderia gladioli]|uniref:hypothetical protein n=1 Tax=Burkholderia gladioli TaxID=28095 RepID=UPI00163E45C2|nr:hypothetical protein [Burkholderia gladioli]
MSDKLSDCQAAVEILKAQQQHIAADRFMCDPECELPQWDALQRVIDMIRALAASPAPAISESDPRLERSIEQWRKCDPDLMSRQSQAAIFYALKDAKHDILALDAARKGEKS